MAAYPRGAWDDAGRTGTDGEWGEVAAARQAMQAHRDSLHRLYAPESLCADGGPIAQPAQHEIHLPLPFYLPLRGHGD